MREIRRLVRRAGPGSNPGPYPYRDRMDTEQAGLGVPVKSGAAAIASGCAEFDLWPGVEFDFQTDYLGRMMPASQVKR